MKLLVTLMLLFLNFSDALSQNNNKNVLMCWSNPWVLADTTQWQNTYENVDIIKLYIGNINAQVDTSLASSFISALLKNDIKIAVELGGLLDWYASAAAGDSSAEYSFEQDYNHVKFLINLIKQKDPNKSIDMIDMDGPLRRMLYPSQGVSSHNVQSAVRELVEVLGMWKDSIPGIKVNLLVNFPNWAWKNTPAYNNHSSGMNGYGHYDSVLTELTFQLNGAGLNFDGIAIDNPYPYVVGLIPSNQPTLTQGVSWINRIRELADEAHLLGWDVNMIFNTPDAAQTAQNYAEQTLEYIDIYHDSIGCPDGYWIQSWYQLPGAWLPETTPYTMTYLTAQVLDNICPATATSISEIITTNSLGISISPNPVIQHLNVRFTTPQTGNYQFNIFNSVGHKVVSTKTSYLGVGEQELQLDVNLLINGVYVLQIYGNKSNITGKFMILK